MKEMSRDKVVSIYDQMGGETVIRQLVKTFYDIVEREPEGKPLFLLHLRGHGIAHSRIEQLNFLSGFLGGPKLYVERYHHSDVRQMHAHVAIDRGARDTWLLCMAMAIDRVGLQSEIKGVLMKHFTRIADMLINQPEASSA